MLSDINSENENSKESRKERARKRFSSSDDNDSDQENIQLLNYPKVPQIKTTHCTPKHVTINQRNNL